VTTVNYFNQTFLDGVQHAHLVSSGIYHADRDKGKCDLYGGRRTGISWVGRPESAWDWIERRL